MSDTLPPDDRAIPTEGGFDDVVAEILAEAARRREAGELPDELLAEIDDEFRRWAPIAYRQRGLEDAIRAVESAAFIDVEPHIDGSRPGVVPVKRTIKKATAFYHLHLARQVTALGVQVARPLRLLADRLDSLDSRVAALEAVAPIPSPGLSHPPLPDLAAALGPHVGGAPGRVAVGQAGSVALVADLGADGLDVYAVEPGASTDAAAEVRDTTLAEHLREVPAAALGGVVAVGLEGELAPAAAASLLDDAVGCVRPGGIVVVACLAPEAWAAAVDVTTRDLAPGRAFEPATWAHLLARRGLTVETTAVAPVTLVIGTLPS